MERTDKGIDRNGVKFAAYSKAYKDSLDFKNAGKGPVNLQLSGDMLASIKYLESTRNWIEVGFENGSVENGKADGNIRGTFGNSKPVAKGRDFLGLPESDLIKIVKYVRKTSDQSK